MIDFSIRSYTHIVLLYTAKILITHTHTHAHTHTPPTHTPHTGTRQTSVLLVKLHLQLYEMYTQEHNLLDFDQECTNFNLLAF